MRLARIGTVHALVAALLALAWFGTAPAGAVLTSGSNLSHPPNDGTCYPPMMGTISCTAAISILPSGSAAAGGAQAGMTGVIVRWRLLRANPPGGEFSVRLRVVRGTTGAGTGPTQTLTVEAGIHPLPARLPVRAGDQVGFDVLNASVAIPTVYDGAGATFDLWLPPLGETENRAPDNNEIANRELTMNVDIEADADGDGFGDESQDGCPTNAAVQSACPSPGGAGADGTAPGVTVAMTETVFRVDANGTVARRRRRAPSGTAFRVALTEPARVRFAIERRARGRRVRRRCVRPTRRNRRRRRCVRYPAVTRFDRQLGAGRTSIPFSGRYRARRRVRSLSPGRYRATVVATDAAGNRSAPSRVRFRVVR